MHVLVCFLVSLHEVVADGPSIRGPNGSQQDIAHWCKKINLSFKQKRNKKVASGHVLLMKGNYSLEKALEKLEHRMKKGQRMPSVDITLLMSVLVVFYELVVNF